MQHTWNSDIRQIKMATNGTNMGENCDSDDEMRKKKKIKIVNCLFNHEAHRSSYELV